MNISLVFLVTLGNFSTLGESTLACSVPAACTSAPYTAQTVARRALGTQHCCPGVLWGRLAVGGEAMLGPGAQVELWGRVAFQVAYQFYPPESKWLLFIEHMNE